MRDRYIILRFLAFHLWRKKIINFSYKSNPDDFLAEVMKTINDFTPDQIHQLEQWFEQSMAQSFAILGADGFRFEAYNVNRRPINMALFEVLAHFFTLVDIKVMEKSVLKKNLAKLKRKFDDSGYFKSRVDSTISVEYRFGEVEKLARGERQ